MGLFRPFWRARHIKEAFPIAGSSFFLAVTVKRGRSGNTGLRCLPRKKCPKNKEPKQEKRAPKKMAARGGYVYAIANDAMPGLVKIGATTRDPMERLHEALVLQASSCTWAPQVSSATRALSSQ